jgi:hypothetical protein
MMILFLEQETITFLLNFFLVAVLDAASEVDERSLSSNVVFLGWNKKQLSRKVMVFQL